MGKNSRTWRHFPVAAARTLAPAGDTSLRRSYPACPVLSSFSYSVRKWRHDASFVYVSGWLSLGTLNPTRKSLLSSNCPKSEINSRLCWLEPLSVLHLPAWWKEAQHTFCVKKFPPPYLTWPPSHIYIHAIVCRYVKKWHSAFHLVWPSMLGMRWHAMLTTQNRLWYNCLKCSLLFP